MRSRAEGFIPSVDTRCRARLLSRKRPDTNMEQLLPHRFLFRFQLPCRYRAGMPTQGEELLDLPEDYALASFADMDKAADFGDVRVAWNEEGLGISVRVMGKTKPPRCDPSRPTTSDALQVWLDTRTASTVHRATRFCHHFVFLPTGGGRRRRGAFVEQLRMNRAREDQRLCDPAKVKVFYQERSGGYLLEAFLPTDVLTGFDPDENRRLGFFYWLKDTELGSQSLGPVRDFPVAEDPSLWSVLELVS